MSENSNNYLPKQVIEGIEFVEFICISVEKDILEDERKGSRFVGALNHLYALHISNSLFWRGWNSNFSPTAGFLLENLEKMLNEYKVATVRTRSHIPNENDLNRRLDPILSEVKNVRARSQEVMSYFSALNGIATILVAASYPSFSEDAYDQGSILVKRFLEIQAEFKSSGYKNREYAKECPDSILTLSKHFLAGNGWNDYTFKLYRERFEAENFWYYAPKFFHEKGGALYNIASSRTQSSWFSRPSGYDDSFNPSDLKYAEVLGAVLTATDVMQKIQTVLYKKDPFEIMFQIFSFILPATISNLLTTAIAAISSPMSLLWAVPAAVLRQITISNYRSQMAQLLTENGRNGGDAIDTRLAREKVQSYLAGSEVVNRLEQQSAAKTNAPRTEPDYLGMLDENYEEELRLRAERSRTEAAAQLERERRAEEEVSRRRAEEEVSRRRAEEEARIKELKKKSEEAELEAERKRLLAEYEERQEMQRKRDIAAEKERREKEREEKEKALLEEKSNSAAKDFVDKYYKVLIDNALSTAVLHDFYHQVARKFNERATGGTEYLSFDDLGTRYIPNLVSTTEPSELLWLRKALENAASVLRRYVDTVEDQPQDIRFKVPSSRAFGTLAYDLRRQVAIIDEKLAEIERSEENRRKLEAAKKYEYPTTPKNVAGSTATVVSGRGAYISATLPGDGARIRTQVANDEEIRRDLYKAASATTKASLLAKAENGLLYAAGKVASFLGADEDIVDGKGKTATELKKKAHTEYKFSEQVKRDSEQIFKDNDRVPGGSELYDRYIRNGVLQDALQADLIKYVLPVFGEYTKELLRRGAGSIEKNADNLAKSVKDALFATFPALLESNYPEFSAALKVKITERIVKVLYKGVSQTRITQIVGVVLDSFNRLYGPQKVKQMIFERVGSETALHSTIAAEYVARRSKIIAAQAAKNTEFLKRYFNQIYYKHVASNQYSTGALPYEARQELEKLFEIFSAQNKLAYELGDVVDFWKDSSVGSRIMAEISQSVSSKPLIYRVAGMADNSMLTRSVLAEIERELEILFQVEFEEFLAKQFKMAIGVEKYSFGSALASISTLDNLPKLLLEGISKTFKFVPYLLEKLKDFLTAAIETTASLASSIFSKLSSNKGTAAGKLEAAISMCIKAGKAVGELLVKTVGAVFYGAYIGAESLFSYSGVFFQNVWGAGLYISTEMRKNFKKYFPGNRKDADNFPSFGEYMLFFEEFAGALKSTLSAATRIIPGSQALDIAVVSVGIFANGIVHGAMYVVGGAVSPFLYAASAANFIGHKVIDIVGIKNVVSYAAKTGDYLFTGAGRLPSATTPFGRVTEMTTDGYDPMRSLRISYGMVGQEEAEILANAALTVFTPLVALGKIVAYDSAPIVLRGGKWVMLSVLEIAKNPPLFWKAVYAGQLLVYTLSAFGRLENFIKSYTVPAQKKLVEKVLVAPIRAMLFEHPKQAAKTLLVIPRNIEDEIRSYVTGRQKKLFDRGKRAVSRVVPKTPRELVSALYVPKLIENFLREKFVGAEQELWRRAFQPLFYAVGVAKTITLRIADFGNAVISLPLISDGVDMTSSILGTAASVILAPYTALDFAVSFLNNRLLGVIQSLGTVFSNTVQTREAENILAPEGGSFIGDTSSLGYEDLARIDDAAYAAGLKDTIGLQDELVDPEVTSKYASNFLSKMEDLGKAYQETLLPFSEAPLKIEDEIEKTAVEIAAIAARMPLPQRYASAKFYAANSLVEQFELENEKISIGSISDPEVKKYWAVKNSLISASLKDPETFKNFLNNLPGISGPRAAELKEGATMGKYNLLELENLVSIKRYYQQTKISGDYVVEVNFMRFTALNLPKHLQALRGFPSFFASEDPAKAFKEFRLLFEETLALYPLTNPGEKDMYINIFVERCHEYMNGRNIFTTQELEVEILRIRHEATLQLYGRTEELMSAQAQELAELVEVQEEELRTRVEELYRTTEPETSVQLYDPIIGADQQLPEALFATREAFAAPFQLFEPDTVLTAPGIPVDNPFSSIPLQLFDAIGSGWDAGWLSIAREVQRQLQESQTAQTSSALAPPGTAVSQFIPFFERYLRPALGERTSPQTAQSITERISETLTQNATETLTQNAEPLVSNPARAFPYIVPVLGLAIWFLLPPVDRRRVEKKQRVREYEYEYEHAPKRARANERSRQDELIREEETFRRKDGLLLGGAQGFGRSRKMIDTLEETVGAYKDFSAYTLRNFYTGNFEDDVEITKTVKSWLTYMDQKNMAVFSGRKFEGVLPENLPVVSRNHEAWRNVKDPAKSRRDFFDYFFEEYKAIRELVGLIKGQEKYSQAERWLEEAFAALNSEYRKFYPT